VSAAPPPEVPHVGARTSPLIPSGVLGMMLFVFSEVMFFAGLISAYAIVKSTAPGGIWPPPGQPRLPIEATAFNTGALILSGVLLFYANRVFSREPQKAKGPVLAALLLASFFVFFQGREWIGLIGEGLTFTSSQLGGFFYLIIGIHGIHAVAAIAGLAYIYVQLLRDQLIASHFWTAQVFWYFVVGIWPILYWQVYL